MKEKEEFDATLGGSVVLPDQIQTYKFTADRVNEIKSLLNAINNPSQTKLVFQTLPKHMRRRAMSHNPKRLPRKYRQAHVAQMRKSGVATVSRRPSRKYRRKASNLQLEYMRRQKKHVWLETHIWHAKRFHMAERWGYKLAQSSCDKSFRSNYRATAKHCLVQDISYESCIELNAPVPTIRDAFKRMTNNYGGLSITAKTYLNANREGAIDLYRLDAHPLAALGRVSFIWKPVNEDALNRVLWLFVHASFYKELLEELVTAFDLSKISSNSDAAQAPKHMNATESVTLIELKDTLNRFRLTGPLSQAVLTKAFKCKPIGLDKATCTPPFGRFLSTDIGAAAHQSQSNYWASVASVSSPAELFPNMVLALNIEDPRINRPVKRTKALPDAAASYCAQFANRAALEIPAHSSVSALWSMELRRDVTSQKMTTSEFCRLRNKHCLVPGERCAFEEQLQPVPVILVQRPGSQNGNFKRLGYGCGWDVIVPSGYGISTWMCLIMWGARAGGLRETETVHREGGCDQFYPDTVAAKQSDAIKYRELRDEYFKKPQNKRENYKKLSIASPFRCDWLQLVQEWTPAKTTDFYVLRDRQQLEQIQKVCAQRLPFSALNITDSNCLIPVHLTMATRGSPGDFAIICTPKPSDLKRNVRKRRQFDNEPVYTEPLRADRDESERKQLRTSHLKLLKRLRRRRVRAKKRKQETAERRVLIAKPGTAKLIAEQLQRMRELWLPEVTHSVRHQCSREVLGYLTQGNFSFVEATVAGVGYVALHGLKKLVDSCARVGGGCRVLVRGTNTRQYRLATIKVIIS